MKRLLVLTLTLLALLPGAASPRPAGGLLGHQWQVSDLAPVFYNAGFTDTEDLATVLAVAGSESFWHDRAYNDNLTALAGTSVGQLVREPTGTAAVGDLLQVTNPAAGTVRRDGVTVALGADHKVVTSRDVGLMQINIRAEDAGTSVEESLYDIHVNIAAAYQLFARRGFQPWYGYTLGVYLRDTYQKIALRGLGNWLFKAALVKPTDTLGGTPYQHKLAHPLLDYEYRLLGMVAVNQKAKSDLYAAITRRDWALVTRVRADLANSLLIPKQ